MSIFLSPTSTNSLEVIGSYLWIGTMIALIVILGLHEKIAKWRQQRSQARLAEKQAAQEQNEKTKAEDGKLLAEADFSNFGIGTPLYQKLDPEQVEFRYYIIETKLSLVAIYRGHSRVIYTELSPTHENLEFHADRLLRPYVAGRDLHISSAARLCGRKPYTPDAKNAKLFSIYIRPQGSLCKASQEPPEQPAPPPLRTVREGVSVSAST